MNYMTRRQEAFKKEILDELIVISREEKLELLVMCTPDVALRFRDFLRDNAVNTVGGEVEITKNLVEMKILDCDELRFDLLRNQFAEDLIRKQISPE